VRQRPVKFVSCRLHYMAAFHGHTSSPLSNRDNAARLLQRSQLEKSMMLREIQELKAQLRAVSMGKTDSGANSLSIGGSPDGRRAQTFNRLLESNLRTGTLACCWCLKFIVTRRLGRAFSTWRLNARLLTAKLLLGTSSSSSGSSSSNDPNSSLAIDGVSSPKGKGRKGKGKAVDSTPPGIPEVPLRISIKRGEADDSSPLSSISGIERISSPQSTSRDRGAVGSSSSGNGASGSQGGIGSSSNNTNIGSSGGSGPGGPGSALRSKTPSSAGSFGGPRVASGEKGKGTPRYLSATKASTHRQWGFYVGDDSTLRLELDDDPEAEADGGGGGGASGRFARQPTSGFYYEQQQQQQSGFFSPQREREKRRQKQSRVTPGGGSSSTLLLPTSSARKKMVSPRTDVDDSKGLRSPDSSPAAQSPLNNSASSGGKGKEKPLYAAQLRLFNGEDGELKRVDYDRSLRRY